MGVNRTFFDQVAHALPGDDDLLLVGAGEVVEHFADHVRTDDENHGRKRRIEVEKSGSVTERQLLGRIRTFAGAPAKRYLLRFDDGLRREYATTRRDRSLSALDVVSGVPSVDVDHRTFHLLMRSRDRSTVRPLRVDRDSTTEAFRGLAAERQPAAM